MNNVLFYSFKIENISFESTGNLSISTTFNKIEAVNNCKRELGKIGFKMAADNSQKIVKKDNELYIEGMAYNGEDPDHKMIQGYFNSLK